jgi:metal-sulfur cluster biosynthetic enzyme
MTENENPLFSVDAVRDALCRVVDPEAGINIVDLGLVYDIVLEGETLRIDLTMTSPACPMGEMIVDNVHSELASLLPPQFVLDVRIVWEPPWSPEKMTDSARQHFGW